MTLSFYFSPSFYTKFRFLPVLFDLMYSYYLLCCDDLKLTDYLQDPHYFDSNFSNQFSILLQMLLFLLIGLVVENNQCLHDNVGVVSMVLVLKMILIRFLLEAEVMNLIIHHVMWHVNEEFCYVYRVYHQQLLHVNKQHYVEIVGYYHLQYYPLHVNYRSDVIVHFEPGGYNSFARMGILVVLYLNFVEACVAA